MSPQTTTLHVRSLLLLGSLACTSPTAPVVPILTTLRVALSSSNILVGESGTASATGIDQNGTAIAVGTITWSSGTPGVASVSASGVITAVSAGQTQIVASAGGKQGQATLTVAIPPVASVVVAPTVANLFTGATQQFAAVMRDAGGNVLSERTVTWSTSNASVVTVNTTTGLATAIAAGSATITATSEGMTGNATVTVLAPVATVTVAPSPMSLFTGATQQSTAALKDVGNTTLTGRTITWATSDAAVVTVNSTTGLATAIAAGSATITATSEGMTGSATVTVLNPVATVTVSPSVASIFTGATQQFTATLRDAGGNLLTGRSISWSTVNGSVATVSTSGVVTAIAQGATSMTAISEGKSGAATITVLPVPVASVVVTPGAASIVAGTTVALTATPKDASGNALSGRTVAWTSSSSAIAAVSQSGVVTAIAPGAVTITAMAEGQSGQATIAVTPAPIATVSVFPGSADMAVGQTLGLLATPRDANGNPLTNRSVTWATSNAGVATVSTTGVVTSIGGGTATITAMSEGVSGRAAIAVAGSFSAQAVLSNELVVEGSPITYSVDLGRGFSAISAVEFHFIFGTDALDPEECLEWRGGFCNPLAVPQTSRTLRFEFSGDPATCDLFRDGVDSRQIIAERFTGSGVVSVRITSLVIEVQGTPLPAR